MIIVQYVFRPFIRIDDFNQSFYDPKCIERRPTLVYKARLHRILLNVSQIRFDCELPLVLFGLL
jgi:hypothetical protein